MRHDLDSVGRLLGTTPSSPLSIWRSQSGKGRLVSLGTSPPYDAPCRYTALPYAERRGATGYPQY